MGGKRPPPLPKPIAPLIKFSADPVAPTDLDASLHQVAAEAKAYGKPISLSIEPKFYWYSRKARLPWRKVIWYITDPRPDLFVQFRLALTIFFRVCGLVGPGRIVTLLRLIDDNPAILDTWIGAPIGG